MAFVAISQLHFYNNSVSYFPGGLWLTVPEKITGSLLLSKMQGVGLSPAKCGGGETAFMEAPSKTPSLWSGGGKPNSAGLRLREAEPWCPAAGWGWPQTAWEAGHSPAISQAEGGPVPAMGQRGWMPSRVGGKKWLLCVFSTVVEFYGMALLFLQHWL